MYFNLKKNQKKLVLIIFKNEKSLSQYEMETRFTSFNSQMIVIYLYFDITSICLLD